MAKTSNVFKIIISKKLIIIYKLCILRTYNFLFIFILYNNKNRL